MQISRFRTGIIFLLCTVAISLNAQDTTKTSPLRLNVGADIVSRYVWRGTDYGNSPAFQPTLSLSIGNFEIGAWGSIAMFSFYKEVDLYAKYSFKGFTLTFTDYYIPSVNGTPASPDTRYFIYENSETAHSLEVSLGYQGTRIPFRINGNMFFYGNDKRWGCDPEKDTLNKTYFSSYFEAGYTFPIRDKSLDVFLGFTPAGGAYGSYPGVVNCGLTGSGRIRITEHFFLPVKTSLIFNPQTSNVYLVFGITL